MDKYRQLGVVAGALAIVTAVAAQTLPGRNGQGWLIDGSGRALYVYDADVTDGQSVCTGACAVVWPPFEAPAAVSPPNGFSVITRVDGRRQWAWHGHPLYRYASDVAGTDKRGDGVNGTWHLAINAGASNFTMQP
ncbi:hypothetical protein ACFWZ4_05520 [Frateuria sp. GZRe12]|uniref:COG4315 family predicted lipoprotein n=1 Tax=Frateuria sp. GZRe12 TaxID=3351533 RepID=UPI003EDBE855